MTDRVGRITDGRFTELWNGSADLDEAAARVRAEVGTPRPRWAVLARAVALRERGTGLKAMPKAG